MVQVKVLLKELDQVKVLLKELDNVKLESDNKIKQMEIESSNALVELAEQANKIKQMEIQMQELRKELGKK